MAWCCARSAEVIEVDAANCAGNVGYGGSWALVYWLVDPAVLPRMKSWARPARACSATSSSRARARCASTGTWPAAMRAGSNSGNAHGTSFNTMTVAPIAAPKTLPWQNAEAYERGATIRTCWT